MIVFSFLNQLIDLTVSPFHCLGAALQLALLSFISTFVLLYAFKRLSNQENIKLNKNKIFGTFLEVAIYRDQFRRSLICQSRIFKSNLLYLGEIGKPLLLLMVPMSIICIQLDYRLGYQPLKTEQSFVIEAQLDITTRGYQPGEIDHLEITTSDTIKLVSPALRIQSTGQIFWNARIIRAGSPNYIRVTTQNHVTVSKEVATQETNLNRFTPIKSALRSFRDLLDSGEENIPSSSPLTILRIAYPHANYPLFKWNFSPIIYYVILTLIFGLLIKPFMKVTI